MIMMHRKIGNVVFCQRGRDLAMKYHNQKALCSLKTDRKATLKRDWMPMIEALKTNLEGKKS